MTAVALPTLHHTALTVTDLDASSRWYGEVFGLSVQTDVPHQGGVGRILTDDSRRLMIALHRHDAADGVLFRETREPAADRPLTQSPIADESYASVLVFRDPDNIQLEFFAPPAH